MLARGVGATSASLPTQRSPALADARAPFHSRFPRSGAGKTTLLDCASQRRSQGRLSGSVLLDGAVPSLTTLKSRTAYIQQDDALFGWCSIAETLAFAAKMKLKGSTAEQRSAAVEDALSQMSLQLARNTPIGSRLTRGCSGGERKRTSVATGLLGSPSWCVACCASPVRCVRADSRCFPTRPASSSTSQPQDSTAPPRVE
jgi:ABC-type molybdate transport system ATPase subunit